MTPRSAARTARLLEGLADPTRLLIAYRLAGGPLTFGEVAGLTGAGPEVASYHLRVMRRAGLVGRRKRGRRRVYSLRPEVFAPGRRPGVVGTLRLGGVRVALLGTGARRDRARPAGAIATPRRPKSPRRLLWCGACGRARRWSAGTRPRCCGEAMALFVEA